MFYSSTRAAAFATACLRIKQKYAAPSGCSFMEETVEEKNEEPSAPVYAVDVASPDEVPNADTQHRQFHIPVRRAQPKDSDAAERAASMLHDALENQSTEHSKRVTSAACMLPLRTFAALDTEDAVRLARLCATKEAAGYGVACWVLSAVLAAWVVLATDTACKQAASDQEVTVWVPPAWIVVLPIAVAAYLRWTMPRKAENTMTSTQLEMALSTMDTAQYMSYRGMRETNAAANTTLASTSVLAASNLASRLLPR